MIYKLLLNTNKLSTYEQMSAAAPEEVLDKATGGRPVETVYPVHIFSQYPGSTRSATAASLAEALWAVTTGPRTAPNIVDLVLSIIREAKVRFENNRELIRIATDKYPPAVVGEMNEHIRVYTIGRYPTDSIEWLGDA